MSFPQIAALALTRFAAWHQHSDEQTILGPRVCHACYRGKPNTGKREERVPPGFQDKRANIHTTLVLDCDVKDLAVLMHLMRQHLWVSCPVRARSSASTARSTSDTSWHCSHLDFITQGQTRVHAPSLTLITRQLREGHPDHVQLSTSDTS